MRLHARCHCGNISFHLDWPGEPAQIQARACTCSFCRKHGGVWTSHPQAVLSVLVADPDEVHLYEFETRTAQFHVCRRCGVVPLASCRIDGRLHSVVNVNTFEDLPPGLLAVAPAELGGEPVDARLERRRRHWIGEVQMPQFRKVTAGDVDFSAAPIFRKTATLKKADVVIAEREQEVETTLDGATETRNTARAGDRIVTGTKGERYVIKADRFGQLYEEDPHDASRYLSRNRVRALQLQEAAEIVAPWGETQRVPAGGYVVQTLDNPQDVYLVSAEVFERTYAPDPA